MSINTNTEKKNNEMVFKKVGGDLGNQVLIHSMPKRFLGIRPTVEKTKNTGLIIILIGVFLLISGLSFFYFYVNNFEQKNIELQVDDFELKGAKKVDANINLKEGDKSPQQKTTQKKSTTTKSKTKLTIIDNEKDLKNKTHNIPVSNSSSSPALLNTEEKASSTEIKKITINQSVSSSTEENKNIAQTKIQYTYGYDTDKDGLSDLEELLLDCDINSDDSDKDGYPDLEEFLKMYNPAGSGSLMTNINISKYINSSYNYSVLYPKIWEVSKMGGDDSVMFKISNSEFIQIIIQDNPNKENIEDWYKKQTGASVVYSNQKVYKAMWNGVRSNDSLTYYLNKPNSDKIFVISYNPGLKNVINYASVLKMMVKSLKINN